MLNSEPAKKATLPGEFLARLQDIHASRPEFFDRTVQSFATNKPLSIRINTLRADPADMFAQLVTMGITAQKVAWKHDSLIIPLTQRQQVLQSELYQQGLLYSQSLSSQLAPMILNPQADEEVLDLCAAPGGKTAQMACMMNNKGRIAAVEKVKNRFYKLKANVEQQGAGIIQTYLSDGTKTWRKTPERFDKVLLDAPCSSESRFKSFEPQSYSHWHLKKIKEVARKQKALIYSAINCLKPGGSLLYCTCSFAPEENEAIVHHALKKFPDAIRIDPIPLPEGFPLENSQAGLPAWRNSKFNDAVRHSVRILPDEVLDGFYLCLIRKLVSTI